MSDCDRFTFSTTDSPIEDTMSVAQSKAWDACQQYYQARASPLKTVVMQHICEKLPALEC